MRNGKSNAVRGCRVPSQLMAAVATTALLLVGCATAPPPPPSAGPGAVAAAVAPGSATTGGDSSPSGAITLYTSVTQATVDAVVTAYETAHPGVQVEVFRAPTGQLAGRIATDLRTGRIAADVLWLTDPLSIEAYAAQGLLRAWHPAAAAGIADAYRGDSFWGTRFLNVVMIRGTAVAPAPTAWRDLGDPAYRGAVAIPDPAVAGSAFGALAYFAQVAGFGIDFYRQLKANGAVPVMTPDDVTTGVAEGRFKVGMTIDNSARTAIAKGSPIQLVWPSDGAIALFSPIAVVAATDVAPIAESFVEFVLSDPGQQAIAATGWQPIRGGAGGPQPGGMQVYPDWTSAFGRQAQLLSSYRAIFGG